MTEFKELLTSMLMTAFHMLLISLVMGAFDAIDLFVDDSIKGDIELFGYESI